MGACGGGRRARTTSGAGTSSTTDASGGPLKWLSVVDEYTGVRGVGGPAVVPGVRGVAVVEGLARARGMPGHIRSDNGPEFIAAAIRTCWRGRVGTLYVEPGSPWENGTRVVPQPAAGEFLGPSVHQPVGGAGSGAEWRRAYNQERPTAPWVQDAGGVRSGVSAVRRRKAVADRGHEERLTDSHTPGTQMGAGQMLRR